MKKTWDDLTFALLQARNPDDPARNDEWRSFVARLEVRPEQVRQVDILGRRLDDSVLAGVDVLLSGGSGEYGVLDDDPRIRRLSDFLVEVTAGDFPTFASCFGFQSLALGLGGEVIEDEDHAEVGSYDLELTAAGRQDPLFRELPDPFTAQMGHKDRVSRLPEGVEPLARTPLCPIQAFRLPGKPVYATQFHCELSYLENKERFRGYMSTYGALFGEDEALRKLYSHRPGPEANGLLKGFVERFVLG
jgi:GMP synthase (glutamine-hydrolysing)